MKTKTKLNGLISVVKPALKISVESVVQQHGLVSSVVKIHC